MDGRNLMELKEFYDEFMQDVYARSGADEDFHESIFTEIMCEELIEQARIEDYTLINFIKTSKGIRLDAWNHNPDSELLSLIVTDFRYPDQTQTLNTTEVIKAIGQGEKFLSESINPRFYSSLEESTPGYEFAQAICSGHMKVSVIEYILLSNAVTSDRMKQIPEKQMGDVRVTYDIWDLSRIHRIRSSKNAREDIIIDFTENHPAGIPCLPAFTGSETSKSYLFVIPGNHLADLYDRYGERLLEQNVRTFLQFRGNVNKGIRNTIQNEPDMFFAYNNGICATAEHVDTDDDNRRIRSIVNMQIVNGGQTTASIFTSRRKLKHDLSRVYVQVKLTVIEPDIVEEVVPKISEYANTQNKVSAADFYSNHPFHLRIEGIARRLWAPSQSGGLRETHWFYERARGQYTNAQANLTPAQQRAFLEQSPRQQMFTKTDLAKYIQSYDMLPHTVSNGAQKNFGDFAGKMATQWMKSETDFNELFFKQLIAKAIIFKQLDKMIMKQAWYGGYKANIVTYTIAKIVYEVSNHDRQLELLNIWTKQDVSDALSAQVLDLAENVNLWIKDTPAGIKNISEWCKKVQCWERIKAEPYMISPELMKETIDLEQIVELKSKAARIQKIDNGINCQTYVFKKGAEYWQRLSAWALEKRLLSDKEMDILTVACLIPDRIPSEKQSAVVRQIEQQAFEEGYWDK
jgi:hypothetical protein